MVALDAPLPWEQPDWREQVSAWLGIVTLTGWRGSVGMS
jgi:hypothetical protein